MKLLRLSALVISVMLIFTACAGGDNNVDSSGTKSEINDDIVTSRDGGKGTFYYPDEDFNNYLTAEKEFDGTAQDIIDTLYELGNYGDVKVGVNNWYIKGNTLHIDFDGELKKATGSSAQEYFSMYGTVKTLKSCFGVELVRLTVNGSDFNTPHGNYDLPI